MPDRHALNSADAYESYLRFAGGGMVSDRKTRETVAIALALVAATVLVYAQVRSYDFINFDDNLYVPGNPHVSGGLTRAKSGSYGPGCRPTWRNAWHWGSEEKLSAFSAQLSA